MLSNRIVHRSVPIAIGVFLTLAPAIRAQVEPGPTSGSAFAVHTSGRLLTNNHVVQNCSEVTVTSQSGEALIGRVLARDARNDLALIAVNAPLTSIATLRRNPIRSGEDVIAVGFPLRGLLALDLNVSKGIVSATAGLGNDTSQLQISAGVQPGNSGGPLLDSDGSVVGIVVSKLDAIAVANAIGDIPQNINFAIKAELAAVFLRSQRIEPRVAPNGLSNRAVADTVDTARGYTFLVVCDPNRQTVQQKADADRRAAELQEEARSKVERAAVARSESEKRQRDQEQKEFTAKADAERRAAELPEDATSGTPHPTEHPAGTTAPPYATTARATFAPRFGPEAAGVTATHALIYVYRDNFWAGKALQSPTVTVDGIELAAMVNGRYLSVWVTPGEHRLDSSCNVPTIGGFHEGLMYFMRVEVRSRGLKGCFVLNAMDTVLAQRNLKKLKPLNARDVKNPAVRLQQFLSPRP